MFKKLFRKKNEVETLDREIQKVNHLLRDDIGMTCEILDIVRSQREAIEKLNKSIDELHKLIKEGNEAQ